MWGNGQREFVAGQQNAAAFLGAQFQMFLELREGGNSVFELPFPIVPEFRSRVWPIPGACETKAFPSPFSEAKVFIFVVDEKVKTLKYRVNAGTWPCATHVNEPAGRAM